MTGNSAIRSMLAFCTAILAAAALYLARSILAPVAFSIFAMTVVWPFQRTLQARMPKLLALLLTVSWLAHLAQDVAATLNSMVGFVLLVSAFTILGLMEVDGAQRRISKLESEYPHLRLSQASKRIARQWQKYIFIRSLTSILTGFVTFLFAAVAGLELAFAWGVIAFVLNLIPFLGPVAAVVLTTLFAAAQFETLQMPLECDLCT